MLDGTDKISLRQLMAILFIGILSPMIKVMPSEMAAVSGKGAWLASLFSILPLLAFVWMLKTLMYNRKDTWHLGEIYCYIFGRVGGKVLCAIYFVWSFVLMTLTLRDYSDRLLSSTYRDELSEVFMLVLLGMTFMVARGKLRAFGRAGEVCMKILIVVILGILLFSTSELKLARVMAVTPQDALATWPSVLACMSIGGITLYGSFLGSSVQREPKLGLRMSGWIIAFLLLMTAMQISLLGTLGVEFTAHLQFPLFILVKIISLFGVIERVESIVVAIWIITDYAFISLLMVAALTLLKFLFNLKKAKQLAAPILLILFTGSILLSSSNFVLKEFTRGFVRIGDLILFFAVPAVAVAVGKIRKLV